MSRDISKIVQAVLEQNPLPEDYRDLPATQRRRVEREAQAASMSPDQYWTQVRAATAAEAMSRREAEGVANTVRRDLRRTG